MGFAGVILAAGESSRMGRDKALLPWPPQAGRSPLQAGQTLLSTAIDALENFCDLVIVVTGKNESALRSVVYARGAFLMRNPAPERGQFSSLQTGLQEVLNQGRDAAMITLVDRPPPQTSTLEKLMNSFANRGHGTWAIIPEYQGKHGHPIVIGREMIEAFLKAPPTGSARDVEHVNQARIAYVAIDDPQVTMNIDTPQDYASLESKF